MNRRQLLKTVASGALGLCVPIAKKTSTGVALYLTVEEAQALANITSKVGGDPRTTARRYIDRINNALGLAGYYNQWGNVATGSIYFEDYYKYRHTFPHGPDVAKAIRWRAVMAQYPHTRWEQIG